MYSNEQNMFEYHVWANNRIFDRLEELPDKLYERKVQSVFDSIGTVIEHMYVTDVLWLENIRERNFDEVLDAAKKAGREAAGKSLTQIRSLYKALEDRYRETLNGGDKSILLEHPEFGNKETTTFEVARHVANHGTYHRGNITAMLRQMGYASVPTDYIYYLYETK